MKIESARFVNRILNGLFGSSHPEAKRHIAETCLPEVRSVSWQLVPFVPNDDRALECVSIPDFSPVFQGRLDVRPFAHITQLHVACSHDTKNVLWVGSPWPAHALPGAPFPPAIEHESQLRAANEAYLGSPREPPTVPLIRVLKLLEIQGCFCPNNTKQIYAYYVRHLHDGLERAVWVIHAWGHPPFEASTDISVHYRNHLRSVVDARTGEWLFADTIPQPSYVPPV